MKKSIRLALLALSIAAGVGAFQGTGQAQTSSQLVTVCFRGSTIQVPFYLRVRYISAGAYNGPCLVTAP